MTTFIGIDIGGTFTDCAVLDEAGRILTIAKAPTSRNAEERGVMDAVAAAAGNLGIGVDELLGRCRLFVHGCTVATNAIIERKGARTALLTTRGHEETFFIGKSSQKVAGLTPQQMTHQSHLEKADPPLVAHEHAVGISERIDRDGDVVVALNEAEIETAAERLREHGVEAVAVSFLWSFLNPAHERRVRDRIAALLPGVYICASHDIAPIMGEYERTATTVASAYVAPRAISYIERLETRLAESGLKFPLLLAHAMGGLTTLEEIRARPLLTLDSGPVSGVLGACFFGKVYGEPDIICADMGGTTFDVALIEGNRAVRDEEPVVDRYACVMPKVAVDSIGAGGGSLLWIDDNGLLRVGPQSAGARPGPACYGRGGEAATITDVNLILGFIDHAGMLGGTMRLDRAKAEAAVDAVASRLSITRTEAALGAYRIVNAHMADLMRRSSIDRGRDPRDFVLFAYGGAGPLHTAYLARDLGIGKVYVPTFATVFSAMGMLTGGILHSAERSCTHSAPLSPQAMSGIEAGLTGLAASISGLFDREHVDQADRSFARFVHMKYRLQQGSLAVPAGPRMDEPGAGDRLVREFEAQYAALYGSNAGFEAAGIEIVKLSVEGRGRTVLPQLARETLSASPDPSAALKHRRQVCFVEIGEPVETPVYDGSLLRPGMSIEGPAVIDRMGDSIVLPDFATASVDAYANVVISLQPA
ncbi:MAG: hydantoinase/oxoprolinase family protein [Hyphomicrobiaceae bacterium]